MDMGLEIHKLADASFIEQMHGLPDRAWSTKANFQCTSQPIPKIIHFVWMGSQLPPKYCAHVQLMADTNPTWKVHLWADHPHVASTAVNATNFEVRDVMQYAHMFRNWDLILNATNLAGKADYLRMEVVHLEGGVYVDTDTIAHLSFDSFEDIFRWPFVAYDLLYKNICNCVFGFEKKAPFLDFALNLTRENCVKFSTCGVNGRARLHRLQMIRVCVWGIRGYVGFVDL